MFKNLWFFLHSDPVHSSAEVSDSRHSLRRRQDNNDHGTNYLTRIPLSQFFRLTADSAQTGASSQICFLMLKVSHKKSYMVCVKFPISKYYITFSSSCLWAVKLLSQFVRWKKNQNKDYVIIRKLVKSTHVKYLFHEIL